MPAPHIPADAYLALLTYGRARASILPADVRPVAAATLASFTASMLAGMKPRSCTGCQHLTVDAGTATARCEMKGGCLIAHAWRDGDARPSWCPVEERG